MLGKGMMAQVDTRRVMARLQGMSIKGKKTAQLQVGFATPYAMYVHENLMSRHAAPTRAKYLEEPMRALSGQMADKVMSMLSVGRSLADALQAAGWMLLVAARAIVPVDTGRLKRSGFIKVR